ncbi:hypothetical protein [Bacillus phage BSTP8]|nr:hypothetical protein BSTP5_009 [Bacillus phage BSTP5]QRI44359.1 hypothetical protein [Bacillus phage BSTP8]QRI44408.1 hypothetical protein [Bacillus phage BSTP10]QRI44538.1 hypothetical protein [Bacillus phage BSTP12]
MMRTAILKQLAKISNRPVYQAFMAPNNVKSPYFTVKMGTEASDVTVRNAYDRYIEIWPYAKPDNFEILDQMFVEAYKALHQTDIQTEEGIFSLTYVNKGEDYLDTDLKLITNGPIEFEFNLIR